MTEFAQLLPRDTYNGQLESHVHPPDWSNPKPSGRYNLGVIGAGTAGCEMAQTFARFGAEVLLVEAEHGILPREDRDAAEIVQDALARDGVKLRCCGRHLKITSDGGTRLAVESHGRVYDEPVDQLLVAVGRAPNVENLNLEAVGVEYNKKGVQVDDRCGQPTRVSMPPEISAACIGLPTRRISWPAS